jgi:hypothetical protein
LNSSEALPFIGPATTLPTTAPAFRLLVAATEPAQDHLPSKGRRVLGGVLPLTPTLFHGFDSFTTGMHTWVGVSTANPTAIQYAVCAIDIGRNHAGRLLSFIIFPVQQPNFRKLA